MKRVRLDIYADFSNSMIDNVINEWVKNEKYRRILHYKIIDGLTYERIAEIEQMSPKRIQDIVYGAEPKLYKQLAIQMNEKPVQA